jgi:Lhr-like helicase
MMTIFEGRDCIGNAKTGSGKTIAFALPILQKLSVDPYGIFALVLTPTRYRILLIISPPKFLDSHRELAFQIAEQLVVLGSPLNVRTAVIVGGMDMITQAIELDNRPHVVVATPGRLVDHLRSSTAEWDLSRVKFLVCVTIPPKHDAVYLQIHRFLMKQTDSSPKVSRTIWLIYLAFCLRTVKQRYSRQHGRHRWTR